MRASALFFYKEVYSLDYKEQLNEIKKHKEVVLELPGWDGEDTFIVKVKRVGLLDLASSGNIPNPLMPAVIEVFNGPGIKPDSAENLKRLDDLCCLFAELTMVEPTYKEVTEIMPLTDEQKMILYTFALKGPRAVESFRKYVPSEQLSEHVQSIQEESK